MRLYNTLSRSVEELVVEDNTVNMYVCGITPYAPSHLGHAMCAVVFDVIRRYLEYKGYKVTFIQNFTDIDDKMIIAAHDEGIKVSELAERNIQAYLSELDRLNVLEASEYPRATEEIDSIIQVITDLIGKGYAYEISGDVYFRVKQDEDYGKLSRRNIDDLLAGARLEIEETKENPADFALWKSQKPREPAWDSPWGPGRPGWHIECTAMSLTYLNNKIDIHGGGQDLVFPHHENEIAQSESFTSEQFAKIWMHAGMITINGEKMSKSVGNVKSINHVLESWGPNVARLFCISGHYSKPIDYTEDLLKENLIRLRQIETCYYELRLAEESQETEDISSLLEESREKFDAALNDDFNTSLGLSVFFNMIKTINSLAAEEKITKKIAEQALPVLEYMLEVLGIEIQTVSDEEIESVFELINKRETLRGEKQFEEADKIRDQIAGLGISLIDHKNKTLWMKKEAIKSEKQ